MEVSSEGPMEPNGGHRQDSYPFLSQLAPPDYCDPVVEVYKRDVDRTILRENLKLTPDQRSRKFERAMQLIYELRQAAENLKHRPGPRT
jgi:hypothetical protein